MRNPGPTILSNDHSQKAKMIAARLRAFVDAIQGRSRLRVGPLSTISLMSDAADLFERMSLDKTPGRRMSADKAFMDKHRGKYFISHGDILVRKAFATEDGAKSWARMNYRNNTGWTILS